MKKKVISLGFVFVLVLTTVPFSNNNTVSATKSSSEIEKEIKDLEQQKNSINKEKDNIANEQSQTENKIEQNKQKQQQTTNEIQALDQELAATEQEINTTQEEITQTEKEIKNLEEEIETLEKRIAKRDELLKNRLRTLQRNGGNISYLEVILGAKDFGDLISRSNAVNTIMDQDKNIMEQQKIEKEELEVRKVEVEEKKATLEEQKETLLALEQQLNAQKKEKETLMAQLQQEEKELEQYQMTLEEQKATKAAEERAIAQLIKQAEQDLQLAKLAEQQKNNDNYSPEVGSGLFIRPAAGYVSSGYGQRWGDLHAGIDIAKAGTVPIYASASGIVYKSEYSPSYGNVVYIAHYLNGKTYTTVYAHMSSRTVSAGQQVSQGQQIGYMGNTGWSYGQHLHFEIHEGEWNYSKSNSVDPRKYIAF